MSVIRTVKNAICFADIWVLPAGYAVIRYLSRQYEVLLDPNVRKLLFAALCLVCVYAASMNAPAYAHGKRSFVPLDWLDWRSDPYMRPSIPHREKYPDLPLKLSFTRPPDKSIVLGRLGRRYMCLPLAKGKATSSIVIGEPGSGKSVLLLDTLLAQSDPVGMLVVDVKGELSAKGTRLDDEDTVVVSPYDRSCYGYEPMYALTDHSTEQDIVDTVKSIAYSLIPVNPKATDSYWSNSARSLFIACAVHLYKTGAHTIIDIVDAILSDSIQSIVEAVHGESASDSVENKLITQFVGMADETLSGIDSNLKIALTIFTDDARIRYMLRDNPKKADPRMINSRKRLFLSISDRDVEIYATVLHLIINQTISEMETRSEDSDPSLIIIDELARILSAGPIQKLENALETLRSRNISVVMITQSLEALQRAYTKDRVDAILSCCPYKVILSASGKDTVDFAVRSAGKYKAFKTSHGKSGRSYSSSSSMEEMDRITAPELIKLPEDGEAIIISPYGYNRVRKVKYWEDSYLKKIADSILAANKKYVELREKIENGT